MRLRRNSTDLLRGALVNLVYHEPFYGTMTMDMVKRVVPEDHWLKTAGVMVGPDMRIHLLVNEKFFSELTPAERVAVLKHECLHVVHMHLLEGPEVYSNQEVANIAMDIAINQYIDNLPRGAQLPETYPHLRLDREKITAYYYNKLMQQAQKMQQLIDSGQAGPLDSHDGHGSGPESKGKVPASIAGAVSKQAIEGAVQACEKSGSWGSVPGGLQEQIMAALKPKVDWRREMRRFVGDTIQHSWEPTRMRRHKRFGWDFPGAKPIHAARILVAVDTSGSVSGAELSQFLAEIAKIADVAEVVIAEIDWDVQAVWNFDRSQAKRHAFKGRGGTSFKTLRDVLRSKGDLTNVQRGTPDVSGAKMKSGVIPQFRQPFNGIVYLTDGEAEFPENYFRIPTLWVMTTKVTAPFGKTVHIDVDEGSRGNPGRRSTSRRTKRSNPSRACGRPTPNTSVDRRTIMARRKKNPGTFTHVARYNAGRGRKRGAMLVPYPETEVGVGMARLPDDIVIDMMMEGDPDAAYEWERRSAQREMRGASAPAKAPKAKKSVAKAKAPKAPKAKKAGKGRKVSTKPLGYATIARIPANCEMCGGQFAPAQDKIVVVAHGPQGGNKWAHAHCAKGHKAAANPWYYERYYHPDTTHTREVLVPRDEVFDASHVRSSLVSWPYNNKK